MNIKYDIISLKIIKVGHWKITFFDLSDIDFIKWFKWY